MEILSLDLRVCSSKWEGERTQQHQDGLKALDWVSTECRQRGCGEKRGAAVLGVPGEEEIQQGSGGEGDAGCGPPQRSKGREGLREGRAGGRTGCCPDGSLTLVPWLHNPSFIFLHH